jgi:hypothetical protein
MTQHAQPTPSENAAAAAEHARALLDQARAAVEGLARDAGAATADALARLAQTRPEMMATLPRDLPVAERTVTAACGDAGTALAHAFDLLAGLRIVEAWETAMLAFGGCWRAVAASFGALVS